MSCWKFAGVKVGILAILTLSCGGPSSEVTAISGGDAQGGAGGKGGGGGNGSPSGGKGGAIAGAGGLPGTGGAAMAGGAGGSMNTGGSMMTGGVGGSGSMMGGMGGSMNTGGIAMTGGMGGMMNTGGAAMTGGMGGSPVGGMGGATNMGGSAPANVLLAHVPFDGAAGPLHGLALGAGFSSSWEVQSTSTAQPGYSLASAPALTFSNLAASPGHAVGGISYLTTGARLDASTSGPFAAYASDGFVGLPGTTLWVSGLLRKDIGSGLSDVKVALLGSAFFIYEGDPMHPPAVAFGFFGQPSMSDGAAFWTLRLGAAEHTLTNLPVVEGQTVFFVMSIAFDATSTVSLYLNPSTLGSAPPAPTVTKTTAAPLRMRTVQFYPGPNPSGGSFDELRFGTSYAAVTPVNP